jgi:hypothetical protein
MRRTFLRLAFTSVIIGIIAGGFFMKGVLPSTVTITSMGSFQRICVEVEFSGQVDGNCLDKAERLTLSGRMKRDGVIYLTLKQGRDASQRSELVYAGRDFPMHCDVAIGRAGDIDKRCRTSSYADLFL